MNGKKMMELCDTHQQFMDECGYLLKDLKEELSDFGDSIDEANTVGSNTQLKKIDEWSPDALQLSYQNNKILININIILRDTGDFKIDEPLILFSTILSSKRLSSVDKWHKIWSCYDILSENIIDTKNILTGKIVKISDLKLDKDYNLFIKNGYIKTIKLFDIKSKKDIKHIANELLKWVDELK